MKVEETENNFERQLPPTGTHVARCVQVVDIGTHKKIWEGEEKLQRQLVLTWELPLEKAVFKEENGEQPFLVTRIYTRSLVDNAWLRKHLESWVGDELVRNDKGRVSYELENLLGKPALVTVSIDKKKDKQYPNVVSVASLMKGTKCPPQITDGVIFDLDNYTEEDFNSLYPWLRKQIEASVEYLGMTQEERTKATSKRDFVKGKNLAEEIEKAPSMDDYINPDSEVSGEPPF
jgi:hypothetical protein